MQRTTQHPQALQLNSEHPAIAAKEAAKAEAFAAFTKTLERLTAACLSQDLSGWRIVVSQARNGGPGISHLNHHLPFEGCWSEGAATSAKSLGESTALSAFRNLSEDCGTVQVFITLEWRYDENTKPKRVHYLSYVIHEGKKMAYDDISGLICEIETQTDI